MIADRTFESGSGLDTTLRDSGFGRPLEGSPRSEPAKDPIPAPAPPTGGFNPYSGSSREVSRTLAGTLATSSGSTTQAAVEGAKRHWPWLLIAAGVGVGLLLWKAK